MHPKRNRNRVTRSTALKWSIVKSTSEPKPQRKAYNLKDTALFIRFLNSLCT